MVPSTGWPPTPLCHRAKHQSPHLRATGITVSSQSPPGGRIAPCGTPGMCLSGLQIELVENRYRAGVDVGCDDAPRTGKNVKHVGAILADAHDPVDFSRSGIVTADASGGFSGEPDFAVAKSQAMRAAQRAQIDGGQRFLRDKVDNRQRVIGAESVVRDVGGFAVGRSNDFVRIVADGNARDGLAALSGSTMASVRSCLERMSRAGLGVDWADDQPASRNTAAASGQRDLSS